MPFIRNCSLINFNAILMSYNFIIISCQLTLMGFRITLAIFSIMISKIIKLTDVLPFANAKIETTQTLIINLGFMIWCQEIQFLNAVKWVHQILFIPSYTSSLSCNISCFILKPRFFRHIVQHFIWRNPREVKFSPRVGRVRFLCVVALMHFSCVFCLLSCSCMHFFSYSVIVWHLYMHMYWISKRDMIHEFVLT